MDRPTTLYVFESELKAIVHELKSGTIRMASNANTPWNPLRPGKEIQLDDSREYVLPDKRVGISLAASIAQLQNIWRPGRENFLFTVDRATVLPEGFAFNKESQSHWMIVLTRKMKVAEFDEKVRSMAREWRLLGKFIRRG